MQNWLGLDQNVHEITTCLTLFCIVKEVVHTEAITALLGCYIGVFITTYKKCQTQGGVKLPVGNLTAQS